MATFSSLKPFNEKATARKAQAKAVSELTLDKDLLRKEVDIGSENFLRTERSVESVEPNGWRSFRLEAETEAADADVETRDQVVAADDDNDVDEKSSLPKTCAQGFLASSAKEINLAIRIS